MGCKSEHFLAGFAIKHCKFLSKELWFLQFGGSSETKAEKLVYVTWARGRILYFSLIVYNYS